MFSFWNLLIPAIVLHQSVLSCHEYANTFINAEHRIKQYVFFDFKQLDWFKANSFCTMNGMSLVSIESAAESAFIEKKMRDLRIAPGIWWTSGNHFAGGENYYWDMFLQRKINYTNWWENEPNNFEGEVEDCIQLKQMNGESKWNDAVCAEKNNFICEYYLGHGVSPSTGSTDYEVDDSNFASDPPSSITVYKLEEDGYNIRMAEIFRKKGVSVLYIENDKVYKYLKSNEPMNTADALKFCEKNDMIIFSQSTKWMSTGFRKYDLLKEEIIAQPLARTICFKQYMDPNTRYIESISCSEKYMVICEENN